MATANCFVHPNPGEPSGLAPAEAAAAGCRVAAPRTVGCHDLLQGRGAVLVAPNSAAALADGVLTALGLPPGAADPRELSWRHTFEGEWRVYRDLRR